MIRMISGTTRTEWGTKSPASGPFSASAAIEERLVRLGVAVYVDTVEPETDKTGVATGAGGENSHEAGEDPPGGGDSSGGLDKPPAYSVDMKAAELRAIMELCGLTYKVGMTKADMVAALDEYYRDADGEDDGEDPPDLSPEAPDV